MPHTLPAARRSLLIVDDDAEVRRLLKRLLTGLVQEIGECTNGPDAIVAVTASHPAVVLMDIGLPGMDGISATRSIREASPSTLVVIVTSHDRRSLRAAASDAGAAAYVLKDDLLEVRALLHDWFGG